MGEFFLWVIIITLIVIVLKIVYDANRKYKWFMKLRPGDKIVVSVFSKYCECLRNAEVIKSSDGKYLDAKIIEDCKKCSEINSKDENGKETCWYNVTSFKKSDIGKYKI